jgi:predicted permease
MLCRNPGFTAVAVLTLALGIGANTAIFSVVHAVLLRPLAFPEPDRLVQVMESREHLGWRQPSFTHANFWDVAKESSSFSEIGAFTGTSLTLTGNDRPRRLAGRSVSPGFFRALGVTPVHGRLFEHGEELPDAENRLVILSYPMWQSTFGSDPQIVGETVRLDGESYRVVGVVPPIEPFMRDVDIFIPLVHPPEPNRTSFELGVVGRLAPSVSESSAAAELDLLAARLESRFPEECKGIGFLTVPSRTWVAGDRLRQALWVLLGATGFMLLIACVNLANMWLSKAVDRAREAALRAALGAGQGRIIRQMLTESLMLCTVGAVVGVVLAFGIVDALPFFGPLGIPRLELVSVNIWVLTFTSGLTLLTGILSGLFPALKLRKAEFATALRSGDRTLVGSRGWTLLRNALVGAEVAISLVLLIGAGLLMRSFVELLQVERGIETDNRMVASVNLPSTYDAPRTQAFFEQLMARVNTLPTVRSAAAVNFRPLLGASSGMGIAIPENPGTPGETVPWATWRMVTPGYFGTLGLEIRQGRDFDQDIIAKPWRVVISESLATQLWPADDNAVGRTVLLWRGQNEIAAEVIGIVEDMRERGLAQDPTMAVYMPYYGVSGWPPEIIIRAADSPLELVPTIRSILAEIDPELPLDDIATLDEVLSNSVTDRRLNTSLMGLFAGVALMLTLVGVYGVQAYAIARRAPEIGLRVVLGAQPGTILAMILREGMHAAVVGAAIGVTAAFWLSKVVANLLFGVAPTDLMTYAGAAALLLVTTLLACYLPARRALAVDPAEVLRAG